MKKKITLELSQEDLLRLIKDNYGDEYEIIHINIKDTRKNEWENSYEIESIELEKTIVMTELIRNGAVEQLDTHTYQLKNYKITEEGLTETGDLKGIDLVKGSKEPSEKQQGFTSEQLLWVVHEYLESVNQGDMRTKNTSLAITHIENALLRMENRTQDRKFRKVQATYKK